MNDILTIDVDLFGSIITIPKTTMAVMAHLPNPKTGLCKTLALFDNDAKIQSDYKTSIIHIGDYDLSAVNDVENMWLSVIEKDGSFTLIQENYGTIELNPDVKGSATITQVDKND